MKKKFWYGILLLLLIFALTQLDLSQMLRSLAEISARTIIVLIALQVFTQLLLNMQWFQVAKFSKVNASFWQMLHINCQGCVVDSITPGVKVGGEVTRALQISRLTGCSGGQAAAVVAVQKLFSLSAFFIVNIFAVLYVMRHSLLAVSDALSFLVMGILAVLLLSMIFILIFPQRLLDILSKRESGVCGAKRLKLIVFVRNMLEGLVLYRKNKSALILQLVLSFSVWLLYPVKLYLLTMQAYPDASLVFLGAVTFASYLVAMLPIFPGGLGGFEAAMAGLLLAGGFMQGDAVAFAVIFRFFTFWFVMFLSLGYIGLSKLFVQKRIVPAAN